MKDIARPARPNLRQGLLQKIEIKRHKRIIDKHTLARGLVAEILQECKIKNINEQLVKNN